MSNGDVLERIVDVDGSPALVGRDVEEEGVSNNEIEQLLVSENHSVVDEES